MNPGMRKGVRHALMGDVLNEVELNEEAEFEEFVEQHAKKPRR